MIIVIIIWSYKNAIKHCVGKNVEIILFAIFAYVNLSDLRVRAIYFAVDNFFAHICDS